MLVAGYLMEQRYLKLYYLINWYLPDHLTTSGESPPHAVARRHFCAGLAVGAGRYGCNDPLSSCGESRGRVR